MSDHITRSELADALDAFWNAALGSVTNDVIQEPTAFATIGAMAEGFAAIARSLRGKPTESTNLPEPISAVSINSRQRAVLERLLEDYKDERYSPLENIAIDLQTTKNAVRLIVRALARKGLAERVPFHDDEGYIRGSGYGISELGRRQITENTAQKSNV